jgi:hypothetical protein
MAPAALRRGRKQAIIQPTNCLKVLDAFRRAIAIVEKSQPPSMTLLATCLNNLGLIYLEGEQFEQSEAVLLRALSIVESEQGPNGPLVYNAIMNLISLYRKTHRDIEANTLGVRAMLIQNH